VAALLPVPKNEPRLEKENNIYQKRDQIARKGLGSPTGMISNCKAKLGRKGRVDRFHVPAVYHNITGARRGGGKARGMGRHKYLRDK